jgi:hypothetical protein
MTIKVETIEAVREKMKGAPEVAKAKRTVSKQESIKELKREIEAMQKKGYTLDDIAKFMTEGGIQITTPTLKSYLQRSKPAKVKTQSKEIKQPAVVASEKTEPAAKSIVEKATDSEKNSGFVRPDSDDI